MADTLKARMAALKATPMQLGASTYADGVYDCIALLDEWSKSPEAVEMVARRLDKNAFEYEGHEVEHAGDKARRSRARKLAQVALSTITGEK